MTEKEAIEMLKAWNKDLSLMEDEMDGIKCHEVAISALEEIKKYHAIGTIEEVKLMQKYSVLAKKVGTIGKVIESCAEYEEIGTVEECREAREKQMPKKPNFKMNLGDYTSRFICQCGKKIIVKHDRGVMDNHDAPNYCSDCGQALDWSD